MYILYGGGVTRALGPQMVLEEGNLSYELRKIDITKQEHRSETFLQLNPAGYVPALVTPEGDVLHEAAAIMLYLADRHGLSDLAPAVDDPRRGIFLSRLFYFTNDVQPSLKRTYYARRFALREEDTAAVAAQSEALARDRWQVIENQLSARGPYHLGKRFSLLDIHLAMWAAYGFRKPGDLLDDMPASKVLFDHVMARPKCGALLQALMDEITGFRQATKR
jgi:glutathione S-transferase